MDACPQGRKEAAGEEYARWRMAERDGKRGAPARPPGSERVERAQHPAAALVEHDYNADGDKVLASRLDQLRQLSYAEALV